MKRGLEHLEVAYTLSSGWEEQELVAHVLRYLVSRLTWNMYVQKKISCRIPAAWNGWYILGACCNILLNSSSRATLSNGLFSFFCDVQQCRDVQTACVEFPVPCAHSNLDVFLLPYLSLEFLCRSRKISHRHQGEHLPIAVVVSHAMTAPGAATPDFHVAMAQQTPIPGTAGEAATVTASNQEPPLESL